MSTETEPSIEELRDRAMSMQAIHLLKAAEHMKNKAEFEAAQAAYGVKKAEVELETMQKMQQMVANRARPSLVLGATLIREPRDDGTTMYVCEWSGLRVEGETPELAFMEFDRVWTQGEDEIHEPGLRSPFR